MQCQICGGDTFDNVAENAQRKARGEKLRPNYKCKDKDCTWVQWPPEDGARPAPKAAPSNAKGAYSGGPNIPGLDGPDEERPELPHEKLDKLFALYDLCFAHAFSLAERTLERDATHEGVSAMAATVFIAAKEKGIAA